VGVLFRSVEILPGMSKEGYHSSLYSLRLLHDCPIHGEALIDACTAVCVRVQQSDIQ
jgi:hypothetical protein